MTDYRICFQVSKLINLLKAATLESKVASTNRKGSAFLLHTSKIFSHVELFSIFSQTFLELIYATKLKTMLLKQSVVLFTYIHT